MGTITRYGGIAASIILIAFGIGAIYSGVDGRDMVRDNLRAEKIVGTPDSSIPGQTVDTGSEAKRFAEYMRTTPSRRPGARPTPRWPRFAAEEGGHHDRRGREAPRRIPADNPAATSG